MNFDHRALFTRVTPIPRQPQSIRRRRQNKTKLQRNARRRNDFHVSNVYYVRRLFLIMRIIIVMLFIQLMPRLSAVPSALFRIFWIQVATTGLRLTRGLWTSARHPQDDAINSLSSVCVVLHARDVCYLLFAAVCKLAANKYSFMNISLRGPKPYECQNWICEFVNEMLTSNKEAHFTQISEIMSNW